MIQHRAAMREHPAPMTTSSPCRAAPLADVEQVELGAEPLGRAPRPAHDPLRAGLGRDEGEQRFMETQELKVAK